MTPTCATPLSDDVLTAYWIGELPDDVAQDVEEHVFACAGCAACLEALASLTAAVGGLAERGRISGVISRAVLNRLQHDGVRVRMYSLAPGETVACAAFPDDDVVVISMRGEFGGAPAATLTVRSSKGEGPAGTLTDVPLPHGEREVLWATPAALVRRYPTARVALTLRSADPGERVLAEYTLDHSGRE